jgi:hypothetical protein
MTALRSSESARFRASGNAAFAGKRREIFSFVRIGRKIGYTVDGITKAIR